MKPRPAIIKTRTDFKEILFKTPVLHVKHFLLIFHSTMIEKHSRRTLRCSWQDNVKLTVIQSDQNICLSLRDTQRLSF